MDLYDDLLQSTGGLPATAFTLQPEDNTSTFGEFDGLLAQNQPTVISFNYPSWEVAHGQDDIFADGIGVHTPGTLAQQLAPNSKEPDSSGAFGSSLFSSLVETSTSTPSSDNLGQISSSPWQKPPEETRKK